MNIKDLLSDKGEYHDFLLEKGVQFLGSGAAAHVYQHPTHKNIAVKVFSTYDKQYGKYLKFCLENQNNTYVPKIYSMFTAEDILDMVKAKEKVPKSVKTAYHIVFMEKLQKLNVKKSAEFAKTLMRAMLDDEPSYATLDDIKSSLKQRHYLKKLTNNLTDQNLRQIFEFLYINISPNDVDLHEGNVMLRGNQIVIVDPAY